MSLSEANAVQVRAQQALSGLTPTKFAGMTSDAPVGVNLGHVTLRTFGSEAEADAYAVRVSEALKPFRDEIEADAIAAIRAALA